MRLLQPFSIPWPRQASFACAGVVVGTVAFQTYAGLLGIKLPGAAIRTGDVDIAQDYGVAVAIDDAVDAPFLNILRRIDKRFSPVPHISSQTAAATYVRPGSYRIDVLITNQGKDCDEPVALPSLKTDAVPLRFLYFLLKETVQAPVLSKTGTLIKVPTPERYAVHKLIVSTMRHAAGESAALMISKTHSAKRRNAAPAGVIVSKPAQADCRTKLRSCQSRWLDIPENQTH